MKTHKIIIGYWLELLVGAFIFFLINSIALDFFYVLLIMLISSEKRMNYLRALMRTYQIANDGKLLSLTKKLGITKEELESFGDELESQLTAEQMKALEEDFKIVGIKL